MQIQLPSAADVAHALEIWGAQDVRLGQLLERYGDPAPALRHYGLVLWEGGQLQAASQVLTGAAALAPGDARVWSDLASVFGALGHQKEAAACVMESLALDATQPRLWMQLGAIRNALGEGAASAEAYRQAVSLDRNLVEAWAGLGLAYLGVRRFREAIEPLQEAMRRGKADDAGLQTCLAQALDGAGDFKGAALAFAIACRLQPDNRTLLLKQARAQFAVDAIRGTADAAVTACAGLGLTADEIEKTARDTFHLLSAYEYRHAAIVVGEWRLARTPGDRMQAYLLAALRGQEMARAPDGYIVSYFDKFADEFDRQLVDVLGYRVPGRLAGMIEDIVQSTGRIVSRILDLGCGTGLAGPSLVRPDRRLTGVDLSPRMLDKARQGGCYDILIEAEAVAFLTTDASRYDLVMAADVLIYFRDLMSVFEGVASVLNPGGLFAFSVETAVDDREIVHLSSGRFAHAPDYVERVARKAGFAILDTQNTTIRLDAKTPALGALFVVSKV